MENLQLIVDKTNAFLWKKKITSMGLKVEDKTISIYCKRVPDKFTCPNSLGSIENCTLSTKKMGDKLSLEQSFAIMEICRKHKEIQFIVKPLFKK